MYYPTYHQLDFFRNPYKVIEWSKSLDFSKPTSGSYPGSRTDNLSNIKNDFFVNFNLQILRLIYGEDILRDEVSFASETYFQKITDEDLSFSNQGWIHTDSNMFLTAIIYLTPDCDDSGTSIYVPKDLEFLIKNSDEKNNYYKNKLVRKNNYIKALEENNNNFKKVAEYKSYFNSMIAFDGSQYHGANFNLKPKQERLTLISFFSKIRANHYPSANFNRYLG